MSNRYNFYEGNNGHDAYRIYDYENYPSNQYQKKSKQKSKRASKKASPFTNFTSKSYSNFQETFQYSSDDEPLSLRLETLSSKSYRSAGSRKHMGPQKYKSMNDMRGPLVNNISFSTPVQYNMAYPAYLPPEGIDPFPHSYAFNTPGSPYVSWFPPPIQTSNYSQQYSNASLMNYSYATSGSTYQFPPRTPSPSQYHLPIVDRNYSTSSPSSTKSKSSKQKIRNTKSKKSLMNNQDSEEDNTPLNILIQKKSLELSRKSFGDMKEGRASVDKTKVKRKPVPTEKLQVSRENKNFTIEESKATPNWFVRIFCCAGSQFKDDDDNYVTNEPKPLTFQPVLDPAKKSLTQTKFEFDLLELRLPKIETSNDFEDMFKTFDAKTKF